MRPQMQKGQDMKFRYHGLQNEGRWERIKTGKVYTGRWEYFRDRDFFCVRFDEGQRLHRREYEVYGDLPEPKGFRYIKDKT